MISPLFPSPTIAQARNHILAIVPNIKKNEISALLLTMQNAIIRELTQTEKPNASNV